MDLLGNPLTTRPIQTGWEFTIEPYPSWEFGFIDDLDSQFVNFEVWIRTRTRSDGPEPFLSLVIYDDGLYKFMIDDNDTHIPSPLIMFTCTVLCHALLEWHKNNGVYPKASKSQLNAARPDHSNYFNYKYDGGMIASCCTVTCRKLLNSSGVVDTYSVLMITWNTLPLRYQQRVYIDIPATVKPEIQQAENPSPAMVISVEVARADNAHLLHHLTSEVVLGEPYIGCTDPNIPIANN